MSLDATAAICWGKDRPFSIEKVVLADLQAEELLVRVVATGICHTDMAVRDQQLPVPLPIVLGHEGAGVVEAVGKGVSGFDPGDRVVMSFNSCGHCPSCNSESPTYCYNFLEHNWSGRRVDGSPTMERQGEPINANFFGQSSFATHSIAHLRNVVKVPESAAAIPLERLAPLGCGIMTGAGAVLRSMKVTSGMPLAVFGTGTVGMAAIMAATISGANPIVAVDMNDRRLAMARNLGATHAFNAKDDAPAQIRELCPDGLAYALDTTGVNHVIEAAWGLLAPKGVVGIVGASDPADELRFNEAQFMSGGRTVKGILGGDSDVVSFLEELINYHVCGHFPFERLIEYFEFSDINRAIEASESGKVIKPVLRISNER